MSGLPVDRTSVAGSEDIERHLNVGFSPCSKCVRWDRTGTIPETVRLQENPAGCCELCKTFWAFAVDKFKSFSTVTIFYYPSELHDHELQIWVEQQDPRYSASKFKIYARADTPCPWGILPQYPWLNLKRMEANLSNCSECHSCYAHRSPARQHDVPPALPTRVLKVGRKPEDIRLLDGRNSHGHYICLSYCWGSVQPLTTTVANLGNHLTSIPWGTLPRLYKDTVRLAWRFGIEFVWIDSLCILQDDRDDWEREAGRMCDVYGNAWLTIAATSSRNCREGILNNPLSGDSVDSFLSSNRLVKWSGSNAANGVEWIAIPQPAQSSSGRHLKVKPEEQEMFPETWPLLTRAWVLQERILSPRVLHFATPELWFECKEEVRCECSGAHLSGPSQIGFGRRIQKPLEKGDAKELGKLWQELVEEYTKLYLTKEEDRLPALSGLAQRFSRAMPGVEYLAGLWGNSFPEGLAWYKESTVEETRQSQAIQGMIPSWSWAASPGPVKFPSTGPFNFWSTHVKARCDPHSNVVRAQCQPMTPSPAGLTEREIGVAASWD